MIHEDDRRILEDWPEAKIITAKKDCILGDHYHKIKTEKFILVNGSAEVNGWKMKKGVMHTIPPGVKHFFKLKKNTVLIGICSHVFDPNDDYK